MIQFLGASLKKTKKAEYLSAVSQHSCIATLGRNWVTAVPSYLDIVTSWQWGVGK